MYYARSILVLLGFILAAWPAQKIHEISSNASARSRVRKGRFNHTGTHVV